MLPPYHSTLAPLPYPRGPAKGQRSSAPAIAAMDWGAPFDMVPVPRRLLQEVLADGTCPLHIRMKLQQAMQRHRTQQALCLPRVGATSPVDNRQACSQAEEPSPCGAAAPPLRQRRVEAGAEPEVVAPSPIEEPEQSPAERGCSPGVIQQQLLEEAPTNQMAAAAATAATAAGPLMLERLTVPASPAMPPQIAEPAQEFSAQCPPIEVSQLRAGTAESATPAQDVDEQAEVGEQPAEECENVRRVEEPNTEAAVAISTAPEQEHVEHMPTVPADRGGGEAEEPVHGPSATRQPGNGAKATSPGKLSHADVAELENEGLLFGAEGAILAEIPTHFLGLAIHVRLGPCVALIAECLALAEVLAMRACSHAALDWVMQRAPSQIINDDGCMRLPLDVAEGSSASIAAPTYAADGLATLAASIDLGALPKVHDRIRTRLWIQRVAELNRDNSDETTFETQVRSFANDALRRRMEAEMAEAKRDMERQIHTFQAEVDRRMEEQAHRVHAIVEERVQQQLDGILATEMEKVRALVEERVQNKVRAVVQREVHTAVCEMQVRLAVLARENDRLRTAFLEHLDHSDLCFRSLVWALSPNATGFFARTLRLVWYCQRRFTKFSAWILGVPPDRRPERLRTRLEAIRRTAGGIPEGEGSNPDGLVQDPTSDEASRDRWGRELEDARRQLLAPAAAAAAVAGKALGIAGGSRSFLPGGGLEGAGTLEPPRLAMALRIAAGEGVFRRAAAAAVADTAAEEGDEGTVRAAFSEASDVEVAMQVPGSSLPEDTAALFPDRADADAAAAASAPIEQVLAFATDLADEAIGADNAVAARQAEVEDGDELGSAVEAAVAPVGGVEDGGAGSLGGGSGEGNRPHQLADPATDPFVSPSAPNGEARIAVDGALAAEATNGDTPSEDFAEGGGQSGRFSRSGEEFAEEAEDFEEALDPSEFSSAQLHEAHSHATAPVEQQLHSANGDDDLFEDALAELPQQMQESVLEADESALTRTGQDA